MSMEKERQEAFDRLAKAMERALEISKRRGVLFYAWMAGAIEDKNELEAGTTMDERRQA